MITTKTLEMIKRHEGFRDKPYKCTAGKLTIGYGRNLDDKGISQKEADTLLLNDIAQAVDDAQSLFSNFDSLDEVRQAVIIDMSFNLGKSRLGGFYNFRAAVVKGDWVEAERQMENSAWFNQLPVRAKELATMMRKGEWQ